MSESALLSSADVMVIRRYVHTKYAPLPGDRRAEIVADAVRRALRQRIPELPAELGERLIDELIARCLVGEKRAVSAEDVLDAASELEGAETIPEERWREAIVGWANERAPGRWSPEQLEQRLPRARGIASSQLQPLSLPEAAPDKPSKFASRKAKLLLAGLVAFVAVASVAGGWIGFAGRGGTAEPSPLAAPAAEPPAALPPAPDVGMPAALRYQDINAAAVKRYLKSRDALLAEEPYFGEIVASAKAHDIHPLLLLAITGQEQGFVPRTNKFATRIANNPFNVFHSWQEYNTDIRDSADIAAKLLAKLAGSRPEGMDAFRWFNETYAEDERWGEGVRKLFERLKAVESEPISAPEPSNNR